MTTSLSAGPSRCDIPALHAGIAPAPALQRERRTLYQFAVHLLGCDSARTLDPDVIDSPLTRSRIGDALAGRATLDSSELVGIGALTDAGDGAEHPQVVARPEANTLLAGALDTVGEELGRQQATPSRPGLLTTADGEQFTSALRLLRDGVSLAGSVSPELAQDLLAHVALIGLVAPHSAGRLSSASPRSFPGLVLLTRPQSALEVAEALIHEGAHQKLFDLAITYDLLTAASDRCPPFHPPWTPLERRWPLEQALAAWHAYACLDRFGQDAGLPSAAREVDSGSLLPRARERSEIIGRWLLDRADHLGADAHTLLEGLTGSRPRRTGETPHRRCMPLATDYVIDAGVQLRSCESSDRVLVGRPAQQPQLYWISKDAAALLRQLRCLPFADVVGTLTELWGVGPAEANDRLTRVMSDLAAWGLVTPTEPDGRRARAGQDSPS